MHGRKLEAHTHNGVRAHIPTGHAMTHACADYTTSYTRSKQAVGATRMHALKLLMWGVSNYLAPVPPTLYVTLSLAFAKKVEGKAVRGLEGVTGGP